MMASIEQNLQSLITAKNDIATAITDKGVILSENAGFLDFANAIDSIISGDSNIEIGTLNVRCYNVSADSIIEKSCIKYHNYILAHANITSDVKASKPEFSIYFDDFVVQESNILYKVYQWVRSTSSVSKFSEITDSISQYDDHITVKIGADSVYTSRKGNGILCYLWDNHDFAEFIFKNIRF